MNRNKIKIAVNAGIDFGAKLSAQQRENFHNLLGRVGNDHILEWFSS